MSYDLVLPSSYGSCISNVVPARLHPPEAVPSWLPAVAHGAERVVLLVLDGLGWTQLQQRRALAPTLCEMDGGPITTVAPSTTATALTSITPGLPPGEHRSEEHTSEPQSLMRTSYAGLSLKKKKQQKT